jgi:hypothetical protein
VFTVGPSPPGHDATNSTLSCSGMAYTVEGDQPPLLAPTNRYQPPRNGYCQCMTRRNTGCYETSGPVGNIVSSETYEYQSWRGRRKLHSSELRMVFKTERKTESVDCTQLSRARVGLRGGNFCHVNAIELDTHQLDKFKTAVTYNYLPELDLYTSK